MPAFARAALLMSSALLCSTVAFADEYAAKGAPFQGVRIASPEATINYTGNTTGGPTWARPIAVSATNCGTSISGVGSATPYSTQQFFVDTAGSYDITSVQGTGGTAAPEGGFDGYIFVYRGSFDPANQFANCVGGNDDGAGGIGTSGMLGVPLDANQTYIIVTTGFGNTDFGPFQNTIAGPGNITLGAFIAAPAVPVDTLRTGGLIALMLLLASAAFVVIQRRN